MSTPPTLSPAPPAVAPGAPAAPAPAVLAELVRAFAGRPDRWRAAVRFDAAARFHTRLEVTGGHEVWLLTWLPGQGTEIHDHGGAAGAFTVVSGVLTERSFPAPPAAPRARELAVGGLRSFGPRYVHEVVNDGTAPAVSIHAYAPALSAMSYYAELPGGGLRPVRTDPVTD
ncbi:cysteine dioxygenase [Streptomyces sp. WAC 06738]|uniref:cysteine dioxygenase n=1 Tax=Streptomyces sp. WAC 06738 TaxID=2203210 RepID=UPI000F6CA742|nr:cysteine dioxygenase family protein [Streptomyces sp. WAC 06738]AZM49409.1 cysteine dioxygenase [Streptomyces sp. WAC 06738]